MAPKHNMAFHVSLCVAPNAVSCNTNRFMCNTCNTTPIPTLQSHPFREMRATHFGITEPLIWKMAPSDLAFMTKATGLQTFLSAVRLTTKTRHKPVSNPITRDIETNQHRFLWKSHKIS